MNLIQDFRYALRQLRKSPGFTLTAVLTLALGIGTTAAVYGVVRSVLLEPLPYADPNRLVGVAFSWPHSEPNAEQTGPAAEFVRDHMQAFSSVAMLDDTGPAVNLSVNQHNAESHPIQVSALRVSEGYFRTMGTMPMLGRSFTPEEDRPGGASTIVISDSLWKRLFNRDAGVVGRTVRVNQEDSTIIGVMPQGFNVDAETAPGVLGVPELWKPLQLSIKDPGYDGDNYEMIGRLNPGVSIELVQQQLSALQPAFYRQYPTYLKWVNQAHAAHEFCVWKLQDVIVSDSRRSLLTVMGAVIAILLIACLNLAVLMTARAMRRSREIALRSALGATRSQLLRLIVCEGLLLALIGGLLAIVVAGAATNVLLHATPLPIPALTGGPGYGVIAPVVMLIALAATGVFSTLPAWALLSNSTREMRLGGPSLGETISHARTSRALIIVQIALAMVLASTASVLLGTFVKLRSLPSGVEPKQLSIVQVTLRGDRYAHSQQTAQFVERVIEQLSHAQGVEGVAAIKGLPLDRGLNDQGYPAGRKELERAIEFRPVTPNYFRTMGIPVLMGRDISQDDKSDSESVVVIGETTAKKWWPGRSPIGEAVHYGDRKDRRIVGVVADVHTRSLVEDQGFVVYGPMVQVSDELTSAINQWFPTTFVMRAPAHLNVAAIAQQAIEKADPEIPVARLATMQEVIDHTIEEPRFFSLLASGFSLFAVGLTIIGLFGLLSYQVTQRTREIGVRMALGADRFRILRSFLGRGISLALAGVMIGLAASWLMRPVIAHLLEDSGIDLSAGSAHVAMNGVQAIAMAGVAILLASLAASWLPARRAASVEPMDALRAE